MQCLWQVLRNFNIDARLGLAIEAIFKNSSRAVLFNSQPGGGGVFKTTERVRLRSLVSPNPFDLFLETIMQKTLHDHHTSISIGGRPTCNLRFAYDIDLMGGSNFELQDFTNRLIDRTTIY